RVAIIQQPLSPYGLAYALRRHREKPWTLPLYIQNKMLNPLAAGLLSFLIDGGRTMLIAGTRSSGKTSLLGACMMEIMSRYRVIVCEGTMELPVDAMRDLDYNILRMKVREALTRESTELSAAEGIRTSLRLGDSALIVGEVRSEEALAMYEAMRVGALANVVAGTIHGANPYGVFDRVVNDLKVPPTSFKATDIIVVVNPIKSADGLHRWRRVLQITEVRKHWMTDPSIEHGFVDLMRYDVKKDELVPTEDLINGESEVLKDIAGNVKGWAGNWDAVWDNIMLRAKIKESIVDVAGKLKMPELLEANWGTKCSNAFHNISDKVQMETGVPSSKHVFPKWQEWLKGELKKVVK
ncbi:MAG: ATPase, T2SS/T4P/T4SS family, partial [Candidatus Paceibacterota bacterium]